MPDEKNIDVDVVDEEKKEDFEDICFLCRRPESKVGKMVHLPNDIHICQNCMQKVFDSMGKRRYEFPGYVKYAEYQHDQSVGSAGSHSTETEDSQKEEQRRGKTGI